MPRGAVTFTPCCWLKPSWCLQGLGFNHRLLLKPGFPGSGKFRQGLLLKWLLRTLLVAEDPGK